MIEEQIWKVDILQETMGKRTSLRHIGEIEILLFVNDVVPLVATPDGLQRQLDALTMFCDF